MESRRLKSDYNVDFIGFMDLIKSALVNEWGSDAPIFTMRRPKATDSKTVEFPQIIYSLDSLEPALIGNKSTREIKPRVREQTKEVTADGTPMHVIYYGQTLEATVSFTIYGQSNEEVMMLTYLFRELMRNYTGLYQKYGILDCIWVKDSIDEAGIPQDDYYVGRVLSYHVRMEEVTKRNISELNHLEIAVSIVHDKLALEGNLPSQEVLRYKIKKKN